MMILVNHHAIWRLITKTIFIKHCRVEIIAFPFMLFHRDRFFNFCCLFRQRFSAAYLLELFLLPQRAHTTIFISYYYHKAAHTSVLILLSQSSLMSYSAILTAQRLPSTKSLSGSSSTRTYSCLEERGRLMVTICKKT